VTWTPPPGTIGLTYSYGFTAFRATLGQTLLNENSCYSHAFIVLDDSNVIEPWPDGVRITGLCDYEDEDVAYGFLPVLSDRQRMSVVSAALSLDGIKHGLSDYLALAISRYRWRVGWARHRVADTSRLLPAQFVAEAYRRAGIELMLGFAPGDVTLDDLGSMFLTSEHWELRTPCVDFGVRGGRYAR
jgi:hypothetical protein